MNDDSSEAMWCFQSFLSLGVSGIWIQRFLSNVYKRLLLISRFTFLVIFKICFLNVYKSTAVFASKCCSWILYPINPGQHISIIGLEIYCAFDSWPKPVISLTHDIKIKI